MSTEIGARVRERLNAYRAQAGGNESDWTNKAVAKQAEMTPDAFSRSLAGERAFTAVELSKLADILGTSMHWLTTGDRDPLELRMSARHSFDVQAKVHDRHDWSLARKVLQDPALALRQVSLDRIADIPDFGDGPAADVAKWARERLVERVGENFADILPTSIEDAFGIDVFVLSFDENFEAYSAILDRLPFIVAHESGAWYRTNFGVAHELGHILADDLSYYSAINGKEGNREPWANAFAANLLMPADTVFSIDWNAASEEEIAEVLWDWGVSTEALRLRLRSLGLFSPAAESKLQTSTLRLVKRYITEEQVSERQKRYVTRHFPMRLIAAHSQEVEAERNSGQVLAWMLGVPVEDVSPQASQPAESDVDALMTQLGLTAFNR